MNLKIIKWSMLIFVSCLLWNYLASIILYYLMSHQIVLTSVFLYLKSYFYLSHFEKIKHIYFVSGISSTIIVIMLWLLLLLKNEAIPDIHGKARFANIMDIKKANLFKNEGVIVGKAYGKYLRVPGWEHIILFAPTGSGKTSGVTIPNLLTWNGSTVVSDIKLELFAKTSKYRSTFSSVFLLNFAAQDGMTHCFNPLDIIVQNAYTRIDELQKLAAIFIPDKAVKDGPWDPQARMLFVALALYVLDTPEIPNTIASIVNLFKAQFNFVDFIKQTVKTRHDLDSVCIHNFMKLAELSERTRSSVTFTFTAAFELFDNPLIVAATSRSDFDIRCLRKEKISIYIGITNDNLVRLSPLITIFYQQVADVLTRKLPQENEPHGVLLLMDEFSALGRMETFRVGIGLFRDYRLRCLIIIQELSQLYQIYGREGAKVFINAKVRIAFTQNDEETCRLIESMLGKKTISVKQQSRHLTTLLSSRAHRTESTQYTARSLMLAQEIRWMHEKKALIILEGFPAMLVNKIAWYEEKEFKSRALGMLELPCILKEVQQIMEENKKSLIKQMENTKITQEEDEELDNLI